MKKTRRKSMTFWNGGATSPTVEFYRLPSGYCRLWWFCFDQDGMTSRTIAIFKCPSWEKAVERSWKIFEEFMQPYRLKTKLRQTGIAQDEPTQARENQAPMADRCAVYVTCSKADAPRFAQEGFAELGPNAQDDNLMDLLDEEGDYADLDLLQKLAEEGIVFFGRHCAGSNYGPCVFASDGKQYEEASSSEIESEPVARIKPGGQVNAVDIQRAARYYGTLARAKKLLSAATEPKPA